MLYHPRDHGLWDFWLFHHEGTTHLFYLQLLDGDTRRHIGHATSTDLTRWLEQEPALLPGTGDAWDNAPLGSGMVLEHRGTFYMMYFTHVPKSGSQFIGIATSQDLFTWTKHPANPVLVPDMGQGIYECDPAEVLDGTPSWRDPFVRYDPEDGLFHAYLAARLSTGPYAHRGCVGHAVSRDLVEWEVRPPVFAPGRFHDYEVPEVDHIGDRYYLLWSTIDAYTNHHATPARGRCGGTFYAISDEPYGGFAMPADNLLVGSGVGRWDNYVGRILQMGEEHLLYYFMRGGSVAGYTSLSAPKTIRTDDDGNLIPGYCAYLDALRTRKLISGVRREWVEAKKCLEGETWSVQDGALFADVDGSYGLPTNVGAKAFLLECDIMLDSAFFAGLGVTDALDANQGSVLKYDKFAISAGAVFDGRDKKVHVLANSAGKTGPVLNPIDSAALPVRRGAPHHLRMVVRGPWTDIFFDDRLTFSLPLPWPEDGQLALLACDGKARFSNLEVHELESY